MKAAKVTFYLEPDIAVIIKKAAAKKMSERVNDLLRKGLLQEKEEQMAAEYERYNALLEKTIPRKKDVRGVSTSMMMAERLFMDDEGSSDEDLF